MIDIEVSVENIYEDGSNVATVVTATVDEPKVGPCDQGGCDLSEWADDNIYPHTGTGRTDGDAAHFAEIVKAPAGWEFLVGEQFEWGT